MFKFLKCLFGDEYNKKSETVQTNSELENRHSLNQIVADKRFMIKEWFEKKLIQFFQSPQSCLIITDDYDILTNQIGNNKNLIRIESLIHEVKENFFEVDQLEKFSPVNSNGFIIDANDYLYQPLIKLFYQDILGSESFMSRRRQDIFQIIIDGMELQYASKVWGGGQGGDLHFFKTEILTNYEQPL